MSVTATSNAILIPVSQPDLRYPKARWYGETNVTGDASAGSASVNILVRGAGSGTKDIYRPMGLSVRATGNLGANNFYVIWGSFEPVAIFAASEVWHGDMKSQLTGGIWTGRVPQPLQAFFGRPLSGQLLNLQAVTLNVNTVIWALNAWGFCWDAEADRLGGPLTPQGA